MLLFVAQFDEKKHFFDLNIKFFLSISVKFFKTAEKLSVSVCGSI